MQKQSKTMEKTLRDPFFSPRNPGLIGLEDHLGAVGVHMQRPEDENHTASAETFVLQENRPVDTPETCREILPCEL